MKANFSRNWRSVLALAVLSALAAGIPGFGLTKAAAQSPANGISGLVNSDLMGDTPSTEQPVDNSTAAAVGPSAPVPPPNVQLYGGSAEIAKLAQAGVGENVMLSYVTNASVRFALTSDQIIYLNDLGLSSPVITAMLQHDASGNLTAPAPVTTADIAANPSPDQPMPDTGVTPPPLAESPDYSDPGTPPGYVDQTPQYPAGYPAFDDAGYFYDSLAPYGSWINLAGYGLCWQPTVVVGNHGWRPYGDRGRWLYTGSGWYWQSDYSWGWAAFHYGRWTRDANLGWMWVPNRVWGPGWVSWRSTADYAGWAPLPPSAGFDPAIGFVFQNRRVGAGFDFGLSSSFYTFIPIERLSDYSPIRYGVTHTVGAGILGQSVVVNNLALQGRQVVNLGINPQRVELAGGTPVRQALVRDASTGDNRFRTDRLEKRGDSLVIFRPQLPSINSTVTSSVRSQAAAAPNSVSLSRSTTAAPVSTVRATTPASVTTLADVAATPSRVHVTYYRQSELAPGVTYSVPAANYQSYPPRSAAPDERQYPVEPQSEASGDATTSYPLAPRGDFSRTRPRSDNTSSRSDGQTGRIGNGTSSFAPGPEWNREMGGDVPRGDSGYNFSGASGQTTSPRQASVPSRPQTYTGPAQTYSGPAQSYSGPAQTYSGPSQSYHGSAPSASSSSSSSSRNR